MKSVRERQISHDITYMWNLNYGINEPTNETNRITDIESRLVVVKGQRLGRGTGWEAGVRDVRFYTEDG